jgi:hypothetical protein
MLRRIWCRLFHGGKTDNGTYKFWRWEIDDFPGNPAEFSRRCRICDDGCKPLRPARYTGPVERRGLFGRWKPLKRAA